MQTIKRKPVANRQIPVNAQQSVSTVDIFHEAKISPPSSPAFAQGSRLDAQTPIPELPRTVVENVDANDLKAYLARSGGLLVEHQDLNNMAKLGHEVVSRDSIPHCCFDNSTPGLPNGSENTSVDNQLSTSLIGKAKENNALDGRRYVSHNTVKAVSQSSDVKPRVQGESHLGGHGPTTTLYIENSQHASAVYEYTEISVEAYDDGLSENPGAVHGVGFLLSETTIARAIDTHRGLKARTGSCIEEITPKSVGPISRMLQAWYSHHSGANIYGFRVPPFEVTTSDKMPGDENYEVLKLLSKSPPYRPRKSSHLSYSHAGCFNYKIQPQIPETLRWKSLFVLFLWSNCMCSHFFSTSSPDNLICCWEILESYTLDIAEGHDQVMKSLRTALITELTEALPKCWTSKAEVMLKYRSLGGASAHATLHVAFLSSPPEECKKIQYGVLQENLRSFLEGSWEPAYPFTGEHAEDMHPDFAVDDPSWCPEDGSRVSLRYRGAKKEEPLNLPGEDENGIRMATFFRALGSIERPARLLTVPRGRALWFSMSTVTYGFELRGPKFPLKKVPRISRDDIYLYHFNIRDLSPPLLSGYNNFISKRLAATKGDRYPEDMEEVENLLLHFYPGAEELKRWLATKAYIFAMAKGWERSANIAHMLEYAPLGVNDDYNSVTYLTQALVHFHNKRYPDAEISCYKALQYREIPEFNRDECYCILSLVARKRGASREADAHLRRIQPTTNYEVLEKKIVYGIVDPGVLESAGIRVFTNGGEGWFEAPIEKFKQAMISALYNPKLAHALFSDVSWIKLLPPYDPLDPEFRYTSYVVSRHLWPNPEIEESWDPIFFYGNRNRPDILQRILETYRRDTGRDPPAFENIILAREVLTQAFRHAAGDTIKFLINNIRGLSINQVLRDKLGRTHSRLHGFIGGLRLSSTTAADLETQDHVFWVAQIKQSLTTAHLKNFFTTLEALTINVGIPFAGISTLKFAALNLEWCYNAYMHRPLNLMTDSIKHDLILAYYCYGWVFSLSPEPKPNSKVHKIIGKVLNGLSSGEIKIVGYPKVGRELAPYQTPPPNQYTSVSVDSKKGLSDVDISIPRSETMGATFGFGANREDRLAKFENAELQSTTTSSSDSSLEILDSSDSIHTKTETPLHAHKRAPEHTAIEVPPRPQQIPRYQQGRPRFQNFIQNIIAKLE
ncbi:hypothetical protein TWF192_004865 [Orbilia oligospora]|uniref:Uncharacterized protein n=1 Tax=Orbilia oligospora TaxID=2813651 RepID=A0A6G1MB50_ORBOL|nr:hypothetical protein TWF191_001040 [Orbilia oligospora]KAF3251369.1 hypothetical protein TWF192_004865 [Orbilia oligospora]